MTEPKATTVFPAIVVRVVDDHTVIINRGEKDGIRKGQRFLVYYLETNPIIDPETGQDLGQLEIVRGRGSATHIQERLTTVYSDQKGPGGRRVVKKRSPFTLSEEEETIATPGEIEPFNDPVKGDKVKPI